jgi:hypothetical protein
MKTYNQKFVIFFAAFVFVLETTESCGADAG